jgi:hypothetical protein
MYKVFGQWAPVAEVVIKSALTKQSSDLRLLYCIQTVSIRLVEVIHKPIVHINFVSNNSYGVQSVGAPVAAMVNKSVLTAQPSASRLLLHQIVSIALAELIHKPIAQKFSSKQLLECSKCFGHQSRQW